MKHTTSVASTCCQDTFRSLALRSHNPDDSPKWANKTQLVSKILRLKVPEMELSCHLLFWFKTGWSSSPNYCRKVSLLLFLTGGVFSLPPSLSFGSIQQCPLQYINALVSSWFMRLQFGQTMAFCTSMFSDMLCGRSLPIQENVKTQAIVM